MKVEDAKVLEKKNGEGTVIYLMSILMFTYYEPGARQTEASKILSLPSRLTVSQFSL